VCFFLCVYFLFCVWFFFSFLFFFLVCFLSPFVTMLAFVVNVPLIDASSPIRFRAPSPWSACRLPTPMTSLGSFFFGPGPVCLFFSCPPPWFLLRRYRRRKLFFVDLLKRSPFGTRRILLSFCISFSFRPRMLETLVPFPLFRPSAV